MRPAEMDVRVGNQRRKKAAAALLAQMQSTGGATAGLGGVRQTGGLARAGAKAGMIRGQGRGIPAGLEALYARAGEFARGNQGGYQLNAEQQPSGVDPAEAAQGYGIGNAISVVDPGGQGGQTAGVGGYQPGDTIPQAPTSGEGSSFLTVGADGSQGAGAPGQGGTATGNPEQNAWMAGQTENMWGFQAPQQYRDGQPVNGGIYYQGTVIPMGVWRAIQQDNGF